MSVEPETRLTRQRKIILEELRKVDTHPSADQVYEMVRKRLPKISLGTVYRNLDFLSAEGLIRTLKSAGSQMRFDGNPDNHYHLRCIKCDRIIDLPISVFDGLDDKIHRITGYVIIGHDLEFQGICPICGQESQKNEGRATNESERHKN
ncbi:MAG: transcriptional repressor [Limnochordia bacterium]|nr:transcriptional repressor [Limnochordia bacterium]